MNIPRLMPSFAGGRTVGGLSENVAMAMRTVLPVWFDVKTRKDGQVVAS